MKKIVALTLAVAMVFSMTACGCDHQWNAATCKTPKTCATCGETEGTVLAHTPGNLEIASVDTGKLTITYNLPCSACNTVISTEESATGIAPVDGKMVLSPEEWYACLSTNLQILGAGQTLIPYPNETQTEDDAIVHSVVSTSGMLTAISFYDAQDNVLISQQQDARNLIHNICIEAQFTNDTAKAFFMFLMVVAMTNNSTMEAEAANQLAAQIMSGNEVTDNGYTYALGITSVENHTVRLDITANA